MQRRTALKVAWPWLLVGGAAHATAAAVEEPAVERLATAWRSDGIEQAAVLQVDWDAGRVQLIGRADLPTRAHGLLALPDGGFLTVANRPGRWLLRCDAACQVQRRLDLAAAGESRSLNGHVLASADRQWLFTTETDPRSGVGWISVRDGRTLARVAQFESQGLDPHQLLLAPDGSLMVANGGIPRDAEGRKIELEHMDSSLVRIDALSGRLLGRWRLADARLSIRHLAWAQGPHPRLGLALQAEHDDATQRAAAPALALWDGRNLVLPGAAARAGGYAGDIAAGPAGGFVISAQKQGQCLWWQPADPLAMILVAELREACALAPAADGGVRISAGRGLARWHPERAPSLLPWPAPLAPDNHWIRLAAA